MTVATVPPLLEIEAIPENLFRDPVDYLHADHARQRTVLNVLDAFVDSMLPAGELSDAWKANLQRIRAYLDDCYPLHIEDEEQDLFPALRSHASEVGVDARLLRRLTRDHHDGTDLLLRLVADLRDIESGEQGRGAIEVLRTALRFIETQRCRLSLADDILLPLAAKLLATDELERIGHRMATRRGRNFPELSSP